MIKTYHSWTYSWNWGLPKKWHRNFKTFKTSKWLATNIRPTNNFHNWFLLSTFSILTISKALLERSEKPFECDLTYRFSQDQLEIAKIRTCFGWNKNVTALQFKHAIRKLLLKNEIESPSTANCLFFNKWHQWNE